MRSTLLLAVVTALFSPFMLHAQQGKKMDIDISSEVLKTAEWAAFKYMEKIDLAQTGDQKAIKEFLEFSAVVDGVEALQHATTCIELIPFTTDEKMGAVIYILKPKLREVLLDRFQLAQGRTKKEEMRKPLQEWAPLTWKALHGEKVVCSSCMSQGLTKAGGQKPAPPAADSEAIQPASATGKQ
ncbi:MAG: hypothetical protein H7246_19595 [Phycisphaerae bacterium]|nr:hypothetical protein [Saprospiraceae bacterium]